MANKRYFNWAGYTIGHLTVLIEAGRDKHGSVLWSCHCGECKSIRELSSGVIKEKHERSKVKGGVVTCGCVNPLLKHGMSESPEYTSWRLAKSRCNNTNREDYQFYGGRGIKMCDRWFHSFQTFYSDMGARPGEGYTLDRINVDGNYEPGNCRWSSRLEQGNNRRNNRLITYAGRTQTLAQWSRELGMGANTLTYRLECWSIDEAFLEPVRFYGA